ncbi:MAG TPA: serine hydrolase [Gemmatimonadales bacterium]|nr:serine hydrolase [Gemmatimonadales bacterium]
MRRLLLFAGAAGLALAGPIQQPVYPGATWDRIADARTAGYSPAGLDSAKAFLGTIGTTGAVVVVGGRILFDYGNTSELSYLASARKSVLAMLYGKYVASGKVRLDKTLEQLGIDDLGGLTPAEREATVSDLLSARSGVYHPASNPGDNLAQAPPRGSQPHGTYYLYSNWDFNAAGAIFEQETGRAIYDALETDLARPIGMEDFDRAAQQKSGDTTKSRYLAYHMWLSTRDMARLGLLMERGGAWNGRQVVPAEWVARLTTPVTRWNEINPSGSMGGRFGYSYLWWIFDGPTATGPFEGAYTAMGAVGQYITVLPKLDMVVAHKTRAGGEASVTRDEYLAFLDRLIAARCAGSCR